MVGLHYFLSGQDWLLYLFSSLLALHHTLVLGLPTEEGWNDNS